MAKRMLADVLWRAANERLSTDYYASQWGRESFSCHAVYCAAHGSKWRTKQHTEVDSFLMELGCDPDCSVFDSDEFLEPQGVRYLWLLLAMHVAEDEGLEIEVSA